MCGIAGFLSKNHRKSYDKNFLRISKELSLRGPAGIIILFPLP